jgi:poly(hydroxyalkanoate) granule-associated protein
MSKIIEKPKAIPTVRESTHQIWLAGLGALSLAEDEGGKLFKALVKRGKIAEASASDAVESFKSKLDLKKATAKTLERVGDTLDDGIATVLHGLGLPSRKEIETLNKRVERLTSAIESRPAHPRRRTTARAAQKIEPVPATTV